MEKFWKISLKNETASAQNIREFWTNTGISKKIIAKIRQNQGFQINGQTVYASDFIKPNDSSEIIVKEGYFDYLSAYVLPKQNKEIEIVYEDEDVLVLDKRANMKMHPHSPNEDDTLLNYVNAYLIQNKKTSRAHQAKAYMVHRLDRATSGLVLIAKNPIVVPILNKQLTKKTMARKYLAIVEGQVQKDAGVICKALSAITNDPLYRQQIDENGLFAKTSWQKVKGDTKKTLLALTLYTGRTHQIRVHLKSIGHPIIGDELYGNISDERLQLHAYQLSFRQPFTNKEIVVQSNKELALDQNNINELR